MKRIVLPLILNTLYSMLGWFICIIQVGSSMIADYNSYLVLALSLLHLFVGIIINIFVYSTLKKNNETNRINDMLLKIDCTIIIVPYILLLLLTVIGWL